MHAPSKHEIFTFLLASALACVLDSILELEDQSDERMQGEIEDLDGSAALDCATRFIFVQGNKAWRADASPRVMAHYKQLPFLNLTVLAQISLLLELSQEGSECMLNLSH
jgi:hypothetical protein